ncbi:hypothetical protein [Streptomyces sp. CG 926]|uniref:hypothetical protein n=1 Tax=Streptomyces sp. CG 926 TaxID=1882405 RepID=UPI000D6D2803|nr:hypothetical protein [Streptomyces sp. CG 926]
MPGHPYRPEPHTIRTTRNAHACRRLLRKESPEQAAAPAGRPADMLAVFGEDDRRRDVLAWTEAVLAG